MTLEEKSREMAANCSERSSVIFPCKGRAPETAKPVKILSQIEWVSYRK
jgi:hypothetical protein